MDNDDGGKSNGDSDRTYNARLPAIIPVTRPSSAARLWRFVRPPWRLILVAGLASGVGILTATLRPYHNKYAGVVPPSPPAHEEASNAGVVPPSPPAHEEASNAGANHPTTTKLIAKPSA